VKSAAPPTRRASCASGAPAGVGSRCPASALKTERRPPRRRILLAHPQRQSSPQVRDQHRSVGLLGAIDLPEPLPGRKPPNPNPPRRKGGGDFRLPSPPCGEGPGGGMPTLSAIPSVGIASRPPFEQLCRRSVPPAALTGAVDRLSSVSVVPAGPFSLLRQLAAQVPLCLEAAEGGGRRRRRRDVPVAVENPDCCRRGSGSA